MNKEGSVTHIERLNSERLEQLFPNGGWDVHHHIFEPARFKYAENRHLTPPAASIRQYIEFKAHLGLSHSVLTHGLSYGDDCASTKKFIQELGANCTFGIGVIDPRTVTPTELRKMHHAGIRGIRVNLYKYGAMHEIELQKFTLIEHATVLKNHCPGWSMAFTHVHPEFWGRLGSIIEEIVQSGVKIVTDHFALLKASSMLPPEYKSDITAQPGFGDILSLVRSGKLYIKISAPYRISEMKPNYSDVRPLVEAFVNANPRQVLWGSDWPHTPRMRIRSDEEALKETQFMEVNDDLWLRNLKSWLSDEEWDMIMIQNPLRLYRVI